VRLTHLLAIIPFVTGASATEAPVRFDTHILATDLKGGYQVVAADLNQDGKPDLIALASGMQELVWFENPTWQRHVLATNQSRMINCTVLQTGNQLQIILASGFENEATRSQGIVSVLTPGPDVRQPWTAREIDRLPTAHRLRIANPTGRGPIVINAPLTNPTTKGPDYRGHTPLVGYPPATWQRELISEANEGVVHGVYITDWDGDGRDEILTASFVGLHLFKLDKSGVWQRTEISKGDPAPWPKSGSSDVAVGQTRKARFLAVIEPWHGHQTVIYRQHKRAWQRQIIDDSLVEGHTILTADLDADGRDEVIAGFRGKGRSVLFYTSDRQGKHWTRHLLDDGGMAANACVIADFNNDKRPDIACIGGATANLKLYENRGPNR
jgi:hypothetical protein